jgi:hypothetical protein
MKPCTAWMALNLLAACPGAPWGSSQDASMDVGPVQPGLDAATPQEKDSGVLPRPDAGPTCTPDCKGRECGPDGCGGSCGTCSAGTCDEQGQCATSPADMTPPTVRINAPTADATVSGIVTMAGTAADDVGLSSVEVQIDSGPFTPATGTEAWSFRWDSAGVSDGSHQLRARATDRSGNSETASVSVHVSNGASSPCDLNATPQSFSAQVSAAKPGQTLCLAGGDYGTFSGASKAGLVTVKAVSGAAASMEISFSSAKNLRLEGLTITSGDISGTTRDITIAHCRFTGLVHVNTDQMSNANILFDHNTHQDIPTCESCFAGRLHVEGSGGQPCGVTIQSSVFSGSYADGIRADAYGVQILDNEFYGLQDMDPYHTDPIQIYGGSHIVIRGNYFHDNEVSAGIMMADGGDHNIVENNVFAPGGYTWGITWLADDSSIIRHNTFVNGQCNFNQRCGIINIGSKSGDPASHGTIIVDNIVTDIGLDNGATLAERHNNLLPSSAATGDIVGVPAFVGGSHPTTREGYKLAPGSPGIGKASNGTDIGIP